MSTLGRKMVSALVVGADVTALYKINDISVLLGDDKVDAAYWDMIDHFVRKYGKLPSRAVLEEHMGEKLPEADETPEYYADQIRPMHIRKVLQGVVAEANEFILKDPEKALAVIDGGLVNLRTGGATSVIDFRDSKALLLKHLKSKWTGNNSYGLGWTTFDKNSGGLMGGDLITLVGKSGLGKTWMVLSRAMHVWETYKIPVMFVSMEITKTRLLERVAALYAHIPAAYMKAGILPNIGKINFEKLLSQKMDEAAKAEAPFYVLDGNLAVTPQEVHRLCRQLGVKALFVDGAYLFKIGKNLRNHERISESATYLKQEIATNSGIPVFATYQFNRGTSNLKKGEKPGLDEIAGSDSIGQLSSVVMGLFEEADNPETLLRRKVSVIKGRDGEMGSFKVKWDFVTLSFDEADPDDDAGEIIIT